MYNKQQGYKFGISLEKHLIQTLYLWNTTAPFSVYFWMDIWISERCMSIFLVSEIFGLQILYRNVYIWW